MAREYSDGQTFEVTVSFDFEEDAGIISDLKDLNEAEQAYRVIQWTRLGHFVSGLAEVKPGKEALREYFAELTYTTDSLIAKLDEHMSTFQTKSMGEIGGIGEKFVLAEMVSRFGPRGDLFTTAAAEGHQGDLLGISPREGVSKPIKILIEVKSYSNPVPSSQVNKFRRDIQANIEKIDAAMFISLSSLINTIPERPLYITVESGIPAFYVTQETPGQKIFLAVWGLITEMLGGVRTQIIPGIQKLSIAAASRLRAYLDDFGHDLNEDIKILTQIMNHADSIVRTSQSIRDSGKELEFSMRFRAKEFRRFIEAEALGLAAGTAPELPTVYWEEELWKKNWIERDTNWDNLGANLKQLYIWLHYVDNLDWEWNEKGLSIQLPNQDILNIVPMSAGLRFIFSEETVKEFKLNFEWERGKVGQILFRKGKRGNLNPEILRPLLSLNVELVEDNNIIEKAVLEGLVNNVFGGAK